MTLEEKVIALRKSNNSCYIIAVKLCPIGATFQEWLAFYYKVIDIIVKNNLQ